METETGMETERGHIIGHVTVTRPIRCSMHSNFHSNSTYKNLECLCLYVIPLYNYVL